MWYFLRLWCLFHTFVALVLCIYYYLGNPSVQHEFIRTLPGTIAIIIGLEGFFLILFKIIGLLPDTGTHSTVPPIPDSISKWKSVVEDLNSPKRIDSGKLTPADHKTEGNVSDNQRSPGN